MKKYPYRGKILQVIRMGHPTLIRPTLNIVDPTDIKIQELAQDLIRTAHKLKNAVGLAATQVNIPLRIFVYRENLNQEFQVVINPQIEYLNSANKPAIYYEIEACFSLPGMAGNVPRYHEICLRYRDLENNNRQEICSGFAARVIQHEIDH